MYVCYVERILCVCERDTERGREIEKSHLYFVNMCVIHTGKLKCIHKNIVHFGKQKRVCLKIGSKNAKNIFLKVYVQATARPFCVILLIEFQIRKEFFCTHKWRTFWLKWRKNSQIQNVSNSYEWIFRGISRNILPPFFSGTVGRPFSDLPKLSFDSLEAAINILRH